MLTHKLLLPAGMLIICMPGCLQLPLWNEENHRYIPLNGNRQNGRPRGDRFYFGKIIYCIPYAIS
ncbi:MAG: hypothetical protein D6730_16000 [Bacteroidetes bacterium]|nr:MAG: hypothetical protein D6730_16000 [Bacteroidota bacterium]